MTKWTTANIPDQTGRTAVITGANTGLGFETAAALAAKGAHVVLAVRNLDKGKEAVDRIRGGRTLPLHPLCGGMPSELAWPYLERAAAAEAHAHRLLRVEVERLRELLVGLCEVGGEVALVVRERDVIGTAVGRARQRRVAAVARVQPCGGLDD